MIHACVESVHAKARSISILSKTQIKIAPERLEGGHVAKLLCNNSFRTLPLVAFLATVKEQLLYDS